MGDTKYRANSIIDKRNIINSNRNTYRQISFRSRSCTAQDPSPRMQRGSAKFFAHNRVTGHPSKSKSFLDPKRRNHYDRHRSILFPLLSLESIFFFLSENRERMDTLSSQTTPIPAILSLYRLQMFSFARLISFVDRSSVISSIQRTRLDPFSFHHFSRYTFLLNEIIVHRRETLFHTHASIVCGRAGRRVYCNPKCSSRLLRQDERPSCTGCWPGPTTGEPW